MKIQFWFPLLWEHLLKQEVTGSQGSRPSNPASFKWAQTPVKPEERAGDLLMAGPWLWDVILFTSQQSEGFGSAPLQGMVGFQIFGFPSPSLCTRLLFIPLDQTLPFHDSFFELFEEFTRLCSFFFVWVPMLCLCTHMCDYPRCVHRQNLKLTFYLFCRHSPPYIWDSLLWRLDCLPNEL